MPLRQEFLRLLVMVQLPILLLGLLQSINGWNDRRTQQDARLVENARAIARLETGMIDTAKVTLRLLGELEEVRTAGPGCRAHLTGLVRDIELFVNYLRLGADGRILCSAIEHRPGMTYGGLSWWPDIGAAKMVQFNGPVFGTLSRRIVLVGTQPLFDREGRFDGAIALSIDMAELRRSIQARHLSTDAVVAIVDEDGRLLATSRRAMLPPLALDAPYGTSLKGRSEAGERWTYSMAPLLSGKQGSGLHIVFAEPAPPFLSRAWLGSWVIFLLPALAILLGSIAIWRGTDALVLRWLQSLSGMAGMFAKGHYRVRASQFDDAPAEFRNLAADLHRMAHAVEDRDRQLTGALERQKLLAREVHHRVRNNLQVMMSMLSLQAARLPKGDGRQAVDQARIRMSALALVHHLAYESGEAGTISSARLLPELLSRLQSDTREAGNVQLVPRIADVALQMDTAVPLALWLAEVVGNALRHAYPGGEGEVRVEFHAADGACRIIVEDNGQGFDPEASRRYGLRLVEAIGRQLGGKVLFESQPGAGARLTLEFRLDSAGRSRS